ncbi:MULTISPECIES: TolC family protein [Niastella]|uniref:TolC family protein n=1 Tax=Niastella soli TaxID=2821487 RepID=A0ABS3YYA9_9BACT|nr:TolC family protein [Niastella soli]MBO9202863.1 TolC family protein [Niastella soli]
MFKIGKYNSWRKVCVLQTGFLLLFLMVVTNALAQQSNLAYYLDNALKNSPLIKDLQNQVLSFSIDSQLVRAILRPQVNANSNNMYAPVINGYGYDEVITNKAQVSTVVAVNKAFISRKNVHTQIAGFQIQAQSAANNVRLTEQDIKRSVTDQYINTFGDWLQLQYNREINDLLAREDTLLKKLTQSNVFKQADYLAFTVTRQRQLLTTAQLEIQYASDYAALSYLAGIQDTLVPLQMEDPQLSLHTLPEYTTSAFFRQYLLDSLKIRNDRALVDLNYKPKINSFADAGYNSSLAYMPYKNWGTSIGVSLTVPIYDGHQRKLQYQKLNLAEQTRQAQRDFFVNQRQQQLFQLIQQLRSTEKLINNINQQIRYTDTLIRVSEKLLGTGDIRVPDFILALSNYFNARNLVTQNYIDRLKLINQINYWNR